MISIGSNLSAGNFHKRPVFIFFGIFSLVLLMPAIYLVASQYNEALFIQYPTTLLKSLYINNLIANLIFLFGLIISCVSFSLLPVVKFGVPKLVLTANIMRITAVVCAVFVMVYFIRYGISKLLNIGTDMASGEFRAMGFDDIPVGMALVLELTRKVFFPLLIAYFYVIDDKKYFRITMIFFILAAASTLDRFPFLIALVFVFYCSYISIRSLGSLVLKMAMMILALGFVASVLTYVQYNQVDVGIDIIFFSAMDFLLHRILLVPSFAATEIGFGYADAYGFFNLKFSRLGYLFGQDRIGFDTANAYFVAPVGVVADAYRNFGYAGVCGVSLLLGWFLARFSRLNLAEPDSEYRSQILFIKGFLIINLSTYLVFGNFFTLGVFATLAFYLLLNTCRFSELNRSCER